MGRTDMDDRLFHLTVYYQVPCCLVADGVIHQASAYLNGNREHCLSTWVEYNGNPVHVLSLSNVADVTLWRDKRSLGLPVCSICETAFNEEQDVLDAWRDFA